MFNLGLGAVVLIATALVFWFCALPVDGKVRAWITPTLESYIAVGFLAAVTLGVALFLFGAASIMG